MKEVYEALGDCTAHFRAGLIVDIVNNKKKGCGYACIAAVSEGMGLNFFWYAFDEIEVTNKSV